MGTRRYRNLLRADGISVGLWCCDLKNLADGPEQGTELPTINIPLYGAFVRRGSTGTELLDPLTCSFSNVGNVWCSLHVEPCRDTGVYVMLDPWRIDGPFEVSYRRLSPKDWLDWRILASTLPSLLPAAAIDATMALVERQLHAPPTGHDHALVRDARARLDRGDVRSVEALAADLGVTSSTLCRSFRRSTGVTVHAWLDGIRVTRAAGAIANGASDLATLAIELGFAHHSHMTMRMRRVFGCTPTELRGRLGAAVGVSRSACAGRIHRKWWHTRP